MKDKRVMKRSSNYPVLKILTKTMAVTFSMLLSATVLLAQEVRSPARGFQAGNSYSFSDIETVNLSNGNLMLNIPLATLPGRGSDGGLQVMLRYDSKLWDTRREDRSDGVPLSDVPGLGYDYSRNIVIPGEHGGWKLDSGGYALFVRNRMDQEPERPCSGPNSAGEDAFRQNGFQWKIEMRLPDGTIKEFRPYGTGYAFNDLYNNGFFEINPNGDRIHYTYSQSAPACGNQLIHEVTTGMNYYSLDGSGTRLFIPHDANDHWTLYYSNGTKVEHRPQDDSSILQRQTDRNGNKLTWTENATVGSYSGTKIENDVGQFVLIGDGGVVQPGINGELLLTTIEKTGNWVRRKYRAADAQNANPGALYEEVSQDFDNVTSITLPENLGQYQFTYYGADTEQPEGTYTEGWGELKSVELPSTAKSEYEYQLDDTRMIASACALGCISGEDGPLIYNSVTKRKLTYDLEYDGNSTETTETILYNISGVTSSGSVTNPDGSVTAQLGGAMGGGYTQSSIQPDGTKTENIWAQNKAPKITGNQGGWGQLTAANAYIKTQFTSVTDGNGNYTLTAIKDFDYDKNGNVLEVRDYDWVPYGDVPRNIYPTAIPTSAVLKCKTINTYYNPTPVATDWTTDSPNHYANPASWAPKLHNVIKSTEIEDGSGNPKARSEFFYDDASNKGNLTQSKMWDNTKGALAAPDSNGYRLNLGNSVSIGSGFDSFGNVTSTTDASGNIALLTYGPISGPTGYVGGVYPTQIVTASGTSVACTAASTYDFYTGLILTSTDVDNGLTNANEYDKLGRPVKAITAQGTALESWVRTEYHDAGRFVVVRADLETKGDGKNVATKFLDQLGRVRLSKRLENAATQSAISEFDGIKIQTRYRFDNPASPASSNGTYSLTSNPYRAATSGAASGEETMGWTRGYSTGTGRHSETSTFSGAALPSPWGGNTAGTGTGKTDISAERTLVTDPAGKQRISRVNALGELTDVWEITAQDPATVPVTFPNQSISYGYQTGYLYDTLGNLVTVSQGSQTRTFSYNSLARLTSAQNPESGTISYVYEANGNLKEKSQLRSGTANALTGFTYDALNRVTQRSYTTPNGTPSNYQTTPTVTYTYDDPNIAHSKGKLTKVSSSVSTTEYNAFDLLGRVTAHKQTTDGTAYTTGYSYNLSGALIEETYPSGRKVRNTLDAAGNLAEVESKKNSASGYWAYADNFARNAAGSVTSMQLGNGHWESTQFNARMQPTQIGLGVTPGNTSLFKLDYSYGTTQNNGNVQSQTITVPTISGGSGFTATQNYTYDQLNRLYDAAETVSGSQTWKQTFTYDRFGNRHFDTQANRTTTLEVNCLPAVCNPEINQTNNRLVGATFDSAGNTTVDGGSQQYVYDGENKMVQAKNSSGTVLGLYSFDGDGKRIKKETADEITVFVYDASGKPVAEYSTQTSQEPQLAYLTNDNLRTPRINTNAGGAVIARHDYRPFGEEISSAQRTSANGYDTDEVRKKFTGYERDSETGLDFANARMLGNFGRFNSPDPMLSSGRIETPQSWNRYAYVLNNPLMLIDPTGLYDWAESAGGKATDDELLGRSTDQSLSKKERKKARRQYNYRQRFQAALKGAKVAAQSDRLNAGQQQQVQESADSFGDEGDGNGVRVGMKSTLRGAKAITRLNEDDSVSVDFDEGLDGDDFIVTVAHEGRHVGDAMDWVYSGHTAGGSTDRGHVNREERAWNVSSFVGQALNKGTVTAGSDNSGNSYKVWSNGWEASDIETRRANGIANIVNRTISPGDDRPYSEEHKHRPLDH
jgi:RHS repeat-associated protein